MKGWFVNTTLQGKHDKSQSDFESLSPLKIFTRITIN